MRFKDEVETSRGNGWDEGFEGGMEEIERFG